MGRERGGRFKRVGVDVHLYIHIYMYLCIHICIPI